MKHFLIGGLLGFVAIALMWEACRISFAVGFLKGYRSGEAECSQPAMARLRQSGIKEKNTVISTESLILPTSDLDEARRRPEARPIPRTSLAPGPR